MAYDFPSPPVGGQQVSLPDGTTRTWDGTKWAASAIGLGAFLPLTGGAMTGPLALVGDPQTNLQPATKQYVDQLVGGGFLPLVGGTLTGSLTIATGTAIDANLYLNKPASGRTAQLLGETAGSLRWSVILGGSGSESGSNAGSDFAIARYSDAGTLLDLPLQITRSTGNLAMSHNLTITAPEAQSYVNATANANTGIILNRSSGYHAYIAGYTGTSRRWMLSVGDNSTESGSNAGSNFSLYRYSDAGALIDSPLTVSRASGLTTLSSLAVNGNATLSGGTTVTGNGVIYNTYNASNVFGFNAQNASTTVGVDIYVNGSNVGTSTLTANCNTAHNMLPLTGGVINNFNVNANLLCNSPCYLSYANNTSFLFQANSSYYYLNFLSNWFFQWNTSNGTLLWYGTQSLWYCDGSGNDWRASTCYATSFPGACDIRLKDDIQSFTAGLTELERLKLTSWRYNGKGSVQPDGRRHVGIHAQDVIDHIPECVHVISNDDVARLEGQMAVDTAPILAAVLNAINELDQRSQELTAQILALKGT